MKTPCISRKSRISGGYQVSLGYLSIYVSMYLVSISLGISLSFYLSYIDKIKKDPTNRIRTSDLRKSMINYSPPLYQLSYGRYPIYWDSLDSQSRGSTVKIKIKNSIAGNRTRGANVKGLNVTNYTTMDYRIKEGNK